VLRSSKLADGERAILVLGLIPNRKGQPMLVDWKAVVLSGTANVEPRIEDLESFVARAALIGTRLPNPGTTLNLEPLQADLRVAVGRMQQHMAERQVVFSQEMATRLADTLARLEALQTKQLIHVQEKFAAMAGPTNLRQGKQEQRQQQIHRVFDHYRTWVRDSLETEPHPHVQVLAAVHRLSGR
jgi:hypothetical protein